MDEDLKLYLDGKFKRIDERFEGIEQRLSGIEQRLDGVEQRLDGIDQKLAGVDQRLAGVDQRFETIDQRFESLANVIASEIGSLHVQIAKTEERLIARIDAVEARQRHDAGLTTTLVELVLKQTRWHEQTDNAIAESAARQTDLSRRLDELERRKAS